jgi:hypothetical protein
LASRSGGWDTAYRGVLRSYNREEDRCEGEITAEYPEKGIKRGFRLNEDPRILKSYVIDSARSGRLKEISEDKEEALLAAVRSNRSGREKSSEILAHKQGISYTSTL